MFRAILIASVAAAALSACTVTAERDRPYSGGTASNPPGWVDRNRDGVDDRTQGSRSNPNNPPGWIDQNRNGVDDRVEQRGSTTYRSGNAGYYDQYGNWRSY
jgi:hypothetical protein